MVLYYITGSSISIHAPRVGSVVGGQAVPYDLMNFNPRSPSGERRGHMLWYALELMISIHAPRVGSVGIFPCTRHGKKKFQSTLPGWGAS